MIKKIFKNPLLRLSSLNTASVLTRIFGGLIASKVIAVFIGPSGLALTGSFRNFLTSLDAFSTLGLQNGVIKYTAQYEEDRQKQYESLCTAFTLIAIAVLIIAALLVVPAQMWSYSIFNGNTTYAWVFRLTGFLLPFYAASLLFMAVLNGYSCFKQVIKITIVTNAVGVVVTALMVWQLGVVGAFMGLLFTACTTCFFCAAPVYKSTGGFAFLKRSYFNPGLIAPLLNYSLMAVVTAVLGSVIYIALRNMIILRSGAAHAGYWEGINRLSTFYLMFITTFLNVYFLPKLSQAKDNAGIKSIFVEYYKYVLPLFAFGLVLVYVLRGFIIRFTLAKSFMPMENLFVWQLAGDFFKACSLILGQLFFAQKMTRAFIVTEIVSFAILYISGSIFISAYGAEGGVMAHAFTYFVYFITLAVYFRKKLL